MIDVRALRDNPEPARASQRARGANPGLVDEIIAADAARREALQAFETLRATQKEVSKSVGRASKEERPAILAQAKELAEQVKAAEAAANAADAEADRLARQDHLALGEGLDAIDTKRGAKVSGARFYYLKGIGARLELAIMTMAMDQALANGFVPMMTPTLVTPQVMGGTGFLNEHSDEIYYLPADDLYLTGTSEVALAGYHADEILDLSGGPKRYMGWSTCYRREAGSAGKDTRGIIRVHQFNKAEMFRYCRPEDAAEEHQRFLAWEEEMLAKVELPYRVIDTAAGDLGTSAARKFDCEAWLPTQERYMEVTSTSNCTTFQARRLGIRERREDGMTAVATLNGTLATTRWIVAFLENHQRSDGSIYVPEALRPYLGGLEVLSPVAR